MNPLEFINQYTTNIQNAAVLLRRMANNSIPLPSLDEVNKVKQELLSIHPKDIIGIDFRCV